MGRRKVIEEPEPLDADLQPNEEPDEEPDELRAPTLIELAQAAIAVQEHADGGLVCRRCGCQHFETTHTRRDRGGIKRYRQCRHCGRKLTTWETTRRPADDGE